MMELILGLTDLYHLTQDLSDIRRDVTEQITAEEMMN